MYSMFLGQPHESIVSWINGHPYNPPDPPTPPRPTTRTATRVWYGDDENVYTDYEIEGSLEGSYEAIPQPTTQIPNVTSAKKIELGSTVTNIGSFAFATCQELTNVTMTDNIINIGSTAFLYCNKLISIIISNNVTSIGESAFSSCNSLTNITIPDSITTISQYAFSNCSGLTSVTIIATEKESANAANVKQLMIHGGCPMNITWNMPSQTKTYVTYTTESGHEGWSGEIEGELKTSLIPEIWNSETVDIGTSVTSIEFQAFYQCGELKNIKIPDSVMAINYGAFSNCNDLLYDKTTLPGFTLVDGCIAYYNYDSSASIDTVILTGIRGICQGSCQYADIRTLVIPASVKFIGRGAFVECPLQSVIFQGRTLEQVQEMDGYGAWGFSTNIISIE